MIMIYKNINNFARTAIVSLKRVIWILTKWFEPIKFQFSYKLCKTVTTISQKAIKTV